MTDEAIPVAEAAGDLVNDLYGDVPQDMLDDSSPIMALTPETGPNSKLKVKTEVWGKKSGKERQVEITTWWMPLTILEIKGTEERKKPEDDLFATELVEILWEVPDNLGLLNGGKKFRSFVRTWRGAGTNFTQADREAGTDEANQIAQFYRMTVNNNRMLTSIWTACGMDQYLSGANRKVYLGIGNIPNFNGMNPMHGMTINVQIRQNEDSGEPRDDVFRAKALEA